MSYQLFLDDIRNPSDVRLDGDWVVVRSVEDAISYVLQNGSPSVISFDHDLGTEKTGLDFAKALTTHDIVSKLKGKDFFFPETFAFYVHSANPVGAENIREHLNSHFQKREHCVNWIGNNDMDALQKMSEIDNRNE